MNMSYNGYVNYETWNVSLWLDNDQGTCNHYTDRACELAEINGLEDLDTLRYELGQEIKDDIEENNPLDSASLYSDLLGASLSSVCWPDVAESFVDLAKERMDEENDNE